MSVRAANPPSAATTPADDHPVPEPVEAELAEVARRIRQWRADARLTLHELAQRSGVATSTIQKVETLQMVPSVAVLLKIARGLGRPGSDFVADGVPRARTTHLTASSRRPVERRGMVVERRPGDRLGPSPNQLAKRDEIMSAAVEVLLRDGVHGCTVRAIAAAAGVSNGAVHYYFRDIEEIVDLAMLHATHGWIAWLRSATATDTAGALPPTERFWWVMAACLEPFAGGDRTLMPLWLEYWATCTRAARVEPLRAVQGVLVSYVAELVNAAGIHNAEERAVAVTAYLFGTGMQESVAAVRPEITQRDIASLCGIAPPTP